MNDDVPIRSRRRVTAALAALALGVTGLVGVAAAAAPAAGKPAPVQQRTYTNPVTADFADTYADPAVIRGKDGFWYLYATSDPLVEGGDFGLMHVARSTDLVDWEYLDTIFDETNRPAWATETSFFWAPDIRYVDGQYVLYYTVTDTTLNEGDDSAIGAATAPTPAGPWTPTDAPVVPPRAAPGGGFFWTFDPAMLADDDGSRYLYFGSYFGGLWVTELDGSGLQAVGEATQVAVNDKFEGAFVLKRDGYYYLMASSANCCAGPSTGYSVFAGRSESPRGPFVDHEGVPLLDSRPGGTQVLVQNGNRWIGAGHHTVVTDLAGQDWIVYHAIDRNDPWLAEPGGINRRPALMDRLDWVDGWPVTRAGAGPSEGPQRAPMTGTLLGIDSQDPAAGRALRGDVTAVDGAFGPYAELDGVARTAGSAPGEARVELDLLLADDALDVRLAGAGPNGVTVTVDPQARELVASYRLGSHRDEVRAPIPEAYDLAAWTALSIHAAEGELHARLSESRLGDVVAEVTLPLRAGVLKPRPVELTGDGVGIDNLSVNRAVDPVTRAVAEPRLGRLIAAEEFDGDLTDWIWLRGEDDPPATVEDGVLRWPLAATDLVGPGGSGDLLLREPPAGDWIVETRLELDLGEEEVRNFQQAGLIVYVDDDTFLRLGKVAIWNTRQAEFGKEVLQDGFLSWGGHTSGPVADTMWLRIHHTTNREGEHRYRSAISTDGETWRWGATWTLPAGSDPSVGVYTGGGDTPETVAEFDYVRFYRAR